MCKHLTILLLLLLCACGKDDDKDYYGKKSAAPTVGNEGEGEFSPDTPPQTPLTPPDTPLQTPLDTPPKTPSQRQTQESEDKGDPLLKWAWHLKNTGKKLSYQGKWIKVGVLEKGGTAGVDANVLSANERGYTGKGVRILLIDNGVDIAHEDLAANMLDGEHRNYRLPDPPWLGNPEVSSASDTGSGPGHGTAVAGLIGAVGGNGLGSRGVAYDAKMAGAARQRNPSLEQKIDMANGNFDIFYSSLIQRTCIYREQPSSLIEQLKYGVTNLRGERGAIYVRRSGVDGLAKPYSCAEDNPAAQAIKYVGNTTLDSINNYPWVILAGGFGQTGMTEGYLTKGSSLWVVAPATKNSVEYPGIITTDVSGCDKGYTAKALYSMIGKASYNPNCNYAVLNGNFSSGAIVSGVVALMLEANGNLTWRDVKYILARTADQLHADIGDKGHPLSARNLAGYVYMPDWITNSAGFKFHNYYGFGGVNADAAVVMAENYTSPFGTFTESSWVDSEALSLLIPDNSATGVSHTINVTENKTIEGVQIQLDVTHTDAGDLGVELTSPSGVKSVIMPINSRIRESNINGWILSSNAFYMENTRGAWTIKLIDGSSGNTGTLARWKIKFFGH